MGFAFLLLADSRAYLGSIDVCGYVRLVGHARCIGSKDTFITLNESSLWVPSIFFWGDQLSPSG